MSYTTITRYPNCDILINWGKSKEGYPSTKTDGEMIDLAVANGYSVITKNGKRGKWYLKGKDKNIEFLRNKLDENVMRHREGVFCLLLE